MVPLLQTLTQLVVVGLTLVSNVQASPDCDSAIANATLRLMPLGASITAGLHSSSGNGYRKYLHDMLLRDGFYIDMVGSRRQGSMHNNENEGWPGFRVYQVEGKARKSVPLLHPDIYTINAGTNDARQDFKVQDVGQRMDHLLEYLWSVNSNSTIILSSLIINLRKDTEANVRKINVQYRELAARKQAENKRIIFVDMDTKLGPQKTQMADGTHPRDVGYKEMAKIFFGGIKEAQAKGWIEAPGQINGCPRPKPAESTSVPVKPGKIAYANHSGGLATATTTMGHRPAQTSSTSAASTLSLDSFGRFILVASGLAVSLSMF